MSEKKLKIRVGKLGFLDMLKFKNLPSRRDKAINAAQDKDIKVDFPINMNAKVLHPESQHMVVESIVDYPEAEARTLVLKRADGAPAAWFKAGQYISVRLDIAGSHVTRPYSISSSPKLTEEGKVAITVKRNRGGFVSEHLMTNVHVGDSIRISAPEGQFTYNRLRDSQNVVAVAGGSGITPFLSMASAIRDGLEDFSLTILFGSRTESSILFREQLQELEKQTDKVKVINVLSDEEKSGYEHGFITSDLIRKYAPAEYSLFICGPEGLYRFMDGEVAKLGLPRRLVRREILGASASVCQNADYPKEALNKVFKVEVHQGPAVICIDARNDESLLVAFERGGLVAPSKCRSGECGWCRCKLISGTVYVPSVNDGRRHSDKETAHVHACCSFPTSDIIVEVPKGDY